MGCDGGSIPTRSDLVRTRTKEAPVDPEPVRLARWFTCALSKEPLQTPLVSCRLGRLYNKESVLQFLLDRDSFGDGEAVAGHIVSRKDIYDLRTVPNPDFAEGNLASATPGGMLPDLKSPFICPLSRREMNGKTRFVYLRGCGCVMAEASLRELASTTHCAMCSRKRSKDDVVVINNDVASGPPARKRTAIPSTPPLRRLDEPGESIITLKKTKTVESLYIRK